MSKNSMIRKDNFLITASYRLTLTEQRLVLLAISKISYDQPIPRRVMVTVKEFLECFPDVAQEHAYNQIQEAVNNLWERKIILADPKQIEDFRWISAKTKYLEGTARIGFSFSPEVMPYLEQLKEQFTKYRLGDISSLKSIYSIRLYEMMMQFQSTGFISISLEDFKKRLGVGQKYKTYRDFKKRVIDYAVAELNRKSLFTITFTPLRQGRAIKILTFRFSER